MSRVRALVLVVCALSAIGYGQLTTGNIFGTVTDASGGAVPNATVTVRDINKGTIFNATTGTSGEYTVTQLIPDTYEVTIEANGFQKFQQPNVILQADQGVKVDASLKPGSVATTIEVTTAAPLLKTDRADVSTSIDTNMVENLPVVNRNFTDLQLTMPGTVQLPWQHAASENPQRSAQIEVEGQDFWSVGYELDGVENHDRVLGIIVINPNLDSVEEVKMSTAGFTAEVGNASGALMSAQTKSGTNNFHGEGFDFLQNDQWVQARDPFTQATPNPLTGKFNLPLRYNQFGGNIGGPIVKDKVFFFADYQGLRRHRSSDVSTFVPTAAERAGDFSSLLGAFICANGSTSATSCAAPLMVPTTNGTGGAGTTASSVPAQLNMIFDPNTGAADGTGRAVFDAGGLNMIPAGRFSSAAKALLAALPGPTPNFGNGSTVNFLGTGREVFNNNAVDTREDWYINSNTQLFGRYSLSQYTLTAPPAFGAVLGGPGLDQVDFAGISSSRDQSLAFGLTRTLTPTLLADYRFSFFKYRVNVSAFGFGQNLGQQFGIPGVNLGDLETSGLPTLLVSSSAGAGALSLGDSLQSGAQCNCPLHEDEWHVQVASNWTKVNGPHQFKWGGDFRRISDLRVPADITRNGWYTFTGNKTSAQAAINGATALVPQSGVPLADFLLGDVNEFRRMYSTSTTNTVLFNMLFFYGQDVWRVTPNLTFNYGLRYEYYQPQHVNAPGAGGWFDFNNANVIVPGYGPFNLAANVVGAKKNFAPRIGLAWQFNGKTVLRAGYGRGFDAGNFGFLFGNSALNIPALVDQDVTFVPPAAPNTFVPAFSLDTAPPSAAALVPPVSSYKSTGEFPLPIGVSLSAYEHQQHVPTIDSWNLSIQRQLSPTSAITAAYVGNKGTHLGAGTNINSPTVIPPINDPLGQNFSAPYFVHFGIPNGLIGDECTCGTNNYHSLQVTYNRQMTKGLQIMANYTKARFMTYNGSWVYGMNYGYGPGSYDIASTVNISHVWDIPVGKGRSYLSDASGPVNAILGGWALNGHWQFHTGLPTTPGYNGAGCPNCPFQTWPDLVGDPYGDGAGTQQHFWNPSAFRDVPAGQQRQGTASWNDLRGPGFWTSNLSLAKNFRPTERVGVELRFDFWNVFNHVNWGMPDSNIDDPTFGQITSTNIFAGDLSPQRSGQVGLKITF